MKTKSDVGAGECSLDPLVRRALIVDFFKLGTLDRCQICFFGGWLSSADTKQVEGQALWALAFERAEARGELPKMRQLIDSANAKSEGPPPSRPESKQEASGGSLH